MNLFWIHGGPGYNSRPEELLIGSKLRDTFSEVHFWNHPSTLRNDKTQNTWTDYLDHLESSFLSFTKKNGPCILACHSFGAYSSISLIKKYSHLIKGIVWISAATDMKNVLQNIFTFISEDYKENRNLENASKVSFTLNKKNPSISDFMENLEPVLLNENFPQYYWTNKEAMNKFYPLMLDEWAFDFECFCGVMAGLVDIDLEVISSVPALLCYGNDEVVVNNHYENIRARKLLSNTKELTFKNTSHFLHLEKTLDFLNVLSSFSEQCFQEEPKSVS